MVPPVGCEAEKVVQYKGDPLIERSGERVTEGIEVECYSGHRGEETPRRFRLGERRVEVIEVVDQWLAPDHRYFKVRGDDGDTYILRHDPGRHIWDLTMFQRGGS
jgi:hypothetical protein